MQGTGKSALVFAHEKGHGGVVELLMKYGADIHLFQGKLSVYSYIMVYTY